MPSNQLTQGLPTRLGGAFNEGLADAVGGPVERDKLSPEKVADVLHSAIHGSRTVVLPNKYNYSQAFVSPRNPVSSVAILARDQKTGETVVKTTLPINNRKLPAAFRKRP